MKRHRRFWSALVFLAIAHGAAIFAGFLSPYDPTAQDRDFPFAPPSRLHFVDAQGKYHWIPHVNRLMGKAGSLAEYREIPDEPYPVRFFITGDKGSAAGDAGRPRLFGVERPGRIFLLGTDEFGRDQFSRLLYGARVSLFTGLAAAAVSVGMGLLLGAVAGFYGGWVDELIMRAVELFLALPWLYCLLAFRAFLPLRMSPVEAFVLMVLVIGAIGWARPARLIRGAVLSARERDYVLAARGFGASSGYLFMRHLFPETFVIIITQAALLIPQYILAEVTLSFLGLGVGEPMPSWGNMLGSLQRYHVLVSYAWMGIPGVALSLLVLGYYVLANSLQEWIKYTRLGAGSGNGPHAIHETHP